VVRHLDGDPKNNDVSNLAWGTQADNIHDKWRHGTMATGDRNGRRTHPESILRGDATRSAKLTEAQAREILLRLARGEKGSHLASEFGVVKTTISSLRHGRNWKHLQPRLTSGQLSKVGGKPDATGKLQKPDGWTPPDVEGVLRRAGWKP
jgi:hypothetical protein